MRKIEPITPAQEQEVIQRVTYWLQRGEQRFGRPFELPPITFDLSGRAAGMYLRRLSQRRIRFNPYLFAKYFQDNLETTVPHEVAHYLTDILYGLPAIRPHGTEWRQIMQGFGVNAARTCSYDLEGIPRRHHRQYHYACGCSSHQLTSRRHNKVSRGEARYACRRCGETLHFSGRAAELAAS